MRVLYHNRTRLPQEIERELNAEYVPLDRLLARIGFRQHSRAAERRNAPL